MTDARANLIKALAYLLTQYDLVVDVHAQVVMDTPEDRELHARAVGTFRAAADPIRTLLAEEGVNEEADDWPACIDPEDGFNYSTGEFTGLVRDREIGDRKA